MPSSPVPAARCHYLLDLLAQVPDPRKRRGRRHALAGLLAVGIAAPHLVAALVHGIGAVLGQPPPRSRTRSPPSGTC